MSEYPVHISCQALLEGNIGVERTAAAELEAAKTAETEAQSEVQKAKAGHLRPIGPPKGIEVRDF